MKKLLIIILCFSVLTACRYKSGSGNVVTEKRSVSGFTSINVSGGFEVEIKTGPTAVEIQSDDNIIKHIETEVSNGVLTIRLQNMNTGNVTLKAYISSPEINGINCSGGASVETKNLLKSGQTFKLTTSGGADITAGIDAPDVSADASGGGEMNLSGRTKNFKVESSSGSTINAKELLSENTTVSASSGASARVHASLSLDASASSGGNVKYRGSTVTVRKNESSGGEVEQE